MRMPDHHMQTGAISQGVCDALQRPRAGRHEGRAQQQVFGRIAGQRQLRRQHQPCTLLVCGSRGLDDARRVAGQVADSGVDLGQRDTHGGIH
jgi:hypothetical protein